jgi:hypothetical protein
MIIFEVKYYIENNYLLRRYWIEHERVGISTETPLLKKYGRQR